MSGYLIYHWPGTSLVLCTCVSVYICDQVSIINDADDANSGPFVVAAKRANISNETNNLLEAPAAGKGKRNECR